MGTHYRGRPAEVRALNAYIKLMRAANSVQARLDRRLAALGLTESQLGVLEALYHLGPLAQGVVGRKLFVSGSNVTTVADNLERRGLIRRRRDPADRRSVVLHLTPAGRRLIARVFPGHVAAIVREFSALGAGEQVELGRLCKKLGLGGAAGQPGG
jgi:MarR family 2-MHQ and catechol resistance regulon transcriptional repressor